MKKNGFTLIELLAVIIILGILMIIAIPAVTEYITNSRKEAYVAIAIKYTDAVINKVNSLEYNFTDRDTLYYVPVRCINLEKGGKSPFGEWKEAYIVVTFNGSNYDYYWASLDSAGYGVTLRKTSTLKKENIVPGMIELSKDVTVGNKSSISDIVGDSCDTRVKSLIANIAKAPTIMSVGADSTVFGNNNITKNQIETIEFVDHVNIPNNAIESWDIGATKDKTVMAWYIESKTNGLYDLKIGSINGVFANANSANLFNGYTKLVNIDFTFFNTAKVTTMSAMFQNASKIERLDLSEFNTSRVTNMQNMFYGMVALKSLDLRSFDTSNVTTMSSMFLGSTNLKEIDLSSFKTSNVKDMSAMFHSLSNIVTLDLSNFDTSKVTNMYAMFFTDSKLVNLDVSSFNTQEVKNMAYMFGMAPNLKAVDISRFNTTNVTSMANMFHGDSSLTSLDFSNFDTSNVDSMQYMFAANAGLTSLDLSHFNTTKVTNMSNMFQGTNLITLDLSNAVFIPSLVSTNIFMSINKSLTIYVKNQDAINFINSFGNSNLKPEIK